MKLWVDDVREPPDDSWTWVTTVEKALTHLVGNAEFPDEVSLDHDLGDGDDTRVLVKMMANRGTWPERINVHSMNPVGREWLEGMIARYKPR